MSIGAVSAQARSGLRARPPRFHPLAPPPLPSLPCCRVAAVFGAVTIAMIILSLVLLVCCMLTEPGLLIVDETPEDGGDR